MKSAVPSPVPRTVPDQLIGRLAVSDDYLRNEEWTKSTDQPIALGYEVAERLAAGAPLNAALQQGQIAISFTDQYKQNGASYTLIFRVQRL